MNCPFASSTARFRAWDKPCFVSLKVLKARGEVHSKSWSICAVLSVELLLITTTSASCGLALNRLTSINVSRYRVLYEQMATVMSGRESVILASVFLFKIDLDDSFFSLRQEFSRFSSDFLNLNTLERGEVRDAILNGTLNEGTMQV